MGEKARIVGMVGVTLAVLSGTVAGCSGTPTAARHSGSTPASTPRHSSAPPISADRPTPVATESNPPGDIPDNQVFVPFRSNAGTSASFVVRVPEGWSRSGRGGDVVFGDKLNRIRITTAARASAPTIGAVTSTVVPELRRRVPKFSAPKVATVTRHSGPVVRLTYQGDSDRDPVTGKVVRDAFERFAFYRQGAEVDITLSGPINADNVDPWRIVSNSFAWR